MTDRRIVLGLDLGTQGARAVAARGDGSLVASSARPIEQVVLPGRPDGWSEQDPLDWLAAVDGCLRDLMGELRAAGAATDDLVAISVDSTSGTIVPVGAGGAPLRPAILYNDRRAYLEADRVNAAAGAFLDRAGYRFNASFALPRIVWLMEHEPDVWASAHCILHAADFVVGSLAGEWGATDQSTALKTGFDLEAFRWPGFMADALGIDEARLPRVAWSGTTLGVVGREAAERTGLPQGLPIAAGMTDSCADQVASGACRVGDWNTVLGSTLVIKGYTAAILRDPLGRIYCHRHPAGHWMPGGASNVGARSIDLRFPGIDRERFGAAALRRSPTGGVVYPLDGVGERFPVNRADALGFEVGLPDDPAGRYAAHLEAVAFIERLAYETAQSLGTPGPCRLFTTGGGALSAAWTQIRADVMGRSILCGAGGAAFGAAILAAAGRLHPDALAAAEAMARIEHTVEPRTEVAAAFEDAYHVFREELCTRGWIDLSGEVRADG